MTVLHFMTIVIVLINKGRNMAQKEEISSLKTRLMGTVIPVSALRSEKSIGVGEFADLPEFGSFCKKMGIGLIQILPVNDTGYDSSPYAALTAFGLHPLYLRIGDLREAAGFENELSTIKTKFNDAVRFPYEALLRAKMELLLKIYEKNRELIALSSSLREWIKINQWIKPYAVFRRLKEAHNEKSWIEWDEDFQKTDAKTIAALWEDPALSEKHLFWAWLQQALDLQFSAAAKSLAEMGIVLMGDIPILMNEDSCDVWAHPENFHLELSAGAPPDMYSPEGQNWGFPTYNWQAQSKDGYSWWKARLKTAEKYYQSYRIDHVLGFFRIWASRRNDISALLGRYDPFVPITRKDLEKLDYDKSRIRWVCEPHILTGEVWDAIRAAWGEPVNEEELKTAVSRALVFGLERIGKEELWLFNRDVRSEKEIAALDIHDGAKAFLRKEWGNRIFFEFEKNQFSPAWYYRNSRAYTSLSGEEKEKLEALLEDCQKQSEKIWEDEGRKLLSILTASSSMLPCAEDLGAVPGCVPKVLTELNILGLRVVRWHREWSLEGEPYVPFEDYPELSVCTPAVHDSSCLREWWDREADQERFCDFLGIPSLPRVYNPGTARIILSKIASAASRFRVFQIQDLLHLSSSWYASDPGSERINIPGTLNEFNWTYRLHAELSTILKDEELVRAVKEIAKTKTAIKK